MRDTMYVIMRYDSRSGFADKIVAIAQKDGGWERFKSHVRQRMESNWTETQDGDILGISFVSGNRKVRYYIIAQEVF